MTERTHPLRSFIATLALRGASLWEGTRTLTGTVQRLHPRGHGIIRADDGSKFAFIPFDVLGHRRVLTAGQRVTFSIRTVQDRVFAQNIASLVERMSKHSPRPALV